MRNHRTRLAENTLLNWPHRLRRGDTTMIRWRPASWAGLIPNGLGQVKPNHYLDILKTAWANRNELPYAWRILRKGVCDGCALGTTGMRDFTMKGIHLCTVRLHLLQLNTMDHADPSLFADVRTL